MYVKEQQLLFKSTHRNVEKSQTIGNVPTV